MKNHKSSLVFHELYNLNYFHASFNASIIHEFMKYLHLSSKFCSSSEHYLEFSNLEKIILIDPSNNTISHQTVNIGPKNFLGFSRYLSKLSKSDINIILTVDTIYFCLTLIISVFFNLRLFVFAHSLPSIYEYNALHRKIIYFIIKISFHLGSFLQRGNVILIFQKESAVQSMLWRDFSHKNVFKSSIIRLPLLNLKSQHKYKNRRFLFLGNIRKDKNFEEFCKLTYKHSIQNAVHVTSSIEHKFNNIHSLFTNDPINSSISSKDVVFLDYNPLHYNYTQSATLIDAISSGAWIYTNKTLFDSLDLTFSKKYYIQIELNNTVKFLFKVPKTLISQYDRRIRGEIFSCINSL